MELINMQSLTLLTTIIAVISNLLSVNEKISKNGLVNSLKIMSYYILPIVFLKQIIIFTYEAKFFLTSIVSIIPIFTLFVIKKKRIRFHSNDDMVFIWISFFSSVMLVLELFVPCIGIENYTSQISGYINGLKNYKITIEMYQYMMNQLFCTLCLILDVVKMILFVMVSFQELVYYSRHTFGNVSIGSIGYDNDISINFRKMVTNSIVLFVITGFGKYILNYVISLF